MTVLAVVTQFRLCAICKLLMFIYNISLPTKQHLNDYISPLLGLFIRL